MKNKLIFLSIFICSLTSEIKPRNFYNKDEYDCLIGTVHGADDSNLKKDFNKLKQVRSDLDSQRTNHSVTNYAYIAPGFKTLPNYIKSELINLSKNDWCREYEAQARSNGTNMLIHKWPESARLILFDLFNHYQFPGFIEMLKSFPEYGERITEIQKKLNGDPKFHKNIDDLQIKIKDKLLCQYIHEESQNYIKSCEKQIFDTKQKNLISENEKELKNKKLSDINHETLEEQLSSNLEIYKKNNNPVLTNYYQKRLQAIELTKTNNKIIEKIKFNPNSKKFLSNAGVDLTKLELYNDTAAKHQLYNEFIEATNEIAALEQNNSGCKEFSQLMYSTINYIVLGTELNKNDLSIEAYLIADGLHNCVSFAKGISKACAGNIQMLGHAVLHPLETKGEILEAAKNINYSFSQAIISLLKTAPVPGEYQFYETNPEWQKAFDREVELNKHAKSIIAESIKQFGNYIKDCPPDKLLDQAGYFVADGIIAHYTAKGVTKLGKFSLAKLPGFSKEISNLVLLACKEGASVVNEGINTLKKYPLIAKSKDTILSSVQRSIEYLKAQEMYLDGIYQNMKSATTNTKLAKLYTNEMTNPFPHFFVPSHTDLSNKTLDYFTSSNKLTSILDKSGNIYQTTKSGFEVICSEFGGKQLALFNNGIPPKILTINKTRNLLNLPNKALMYFYGIQVDINKLSKNLVNLQHTFAELKGLPLTMDLEHILTFDPKALAKGKLKGLHHDLNNFLEKNANEIIQFTNKQINTLGILKSDIMLNGKLYEGKTFFPSSWSREKVIHKIIEATKNIDSTPIKQWNNNWKIIGKTIEGIKIEIIIKPSGEIITAYPLVI